jgi:hypothetical protein
VNILTCPLPTAVRVEGTTVPITTDFRTCLQTILAFEDDKLTVCEKQVVLLFNSYGENLPENVEEAARQAVRFLDRDVGEEGGMPVSPMRLYSFSRDGDLIFAAFRQTHGIDLDTAEMHWWKFLALFMDLGADTAFCNLVALRRRVRTGKATKDEREEARNLGDMMDVPEPDMRTLKEREQEREFMRALNSGRRKDANS